MNNKNDCFYCNKIEKLNELMIEVKELNVSTLYLFKEQTYKGRCIVAYKDHVNELFDLNEKELELYMKDVTHVASILKRIFKAEKINLGVYSDKLPHLHFHVVPKYIDETSWGTTFEMSPNIRKELSDKEYKEMIKLIKDNL